MRINTCWYCSSNVYPGHGTMFVRNDCKTFRFCRPKCHKHFKMKHNPKKLKWTKASRKSRGKEMTIDSTFDFEKRRNIPTRYDRNLWINTVQAMKRINAIREARKVRFHQRRLAEQVKIRQSGALKEIEKGQDLVKSIKARKNMTTVLSTRIVKKVKKPASALKVSVKDTPMA